MERPDRRKAILTAAGILAGVVCGAWAVLSGRAVAADKPTAQPTTQPAADPYKLKLEQAWRELDMVNYPRAAEILKEVLAGSPSRVQRAEATFALGHLWQYRRPGEDIAEAKRKYQEVADKFPDTPAGPLAFMSLARLADMPEYEKSRDREEARRLYRRIIEAYSGHFVTHEAVLRLAQTYLENRSDPASQAEGMRMLTDHLAAHPGNYLATVMNIQLGGVYQMQGKFREAIRYYIAADAADAAAAEAELSPRERALPPDQRASQVGQYRTMDRSSRAGLYFRIAKVAEQRLQEYALAAHWYDRIVHEIQRDNKFYVSKLSAERCRELAAKAGVTVPPWKPPGQEGAP